VHKNYQDALSQGGDASKGLDVFRKNCAACHRVEDHGYELGPNLAAVKAKGVDAILANILEPNLEVNPQYINYVLLKSDGTTATGMIASENATSVTLKRGEGATEVILREDIEEMRSSRKSIMPEELEKAINPSEMTDLITYLMTVN
jgi:putative heme-binding domain-containing protein